MNFDIFALVLSPLAHVLPMTVAKLLGIRWSAPSSNSGIEAVTTSFGSNARRCILHERHNTPASVGVIDRSGKIATPVAAVLPTNPLVRHASAPRIASAERCTGPKHVSVAQWIERAPPKR